MHYVASSDKAIPNATPGGKTLEQTASHTKTDLGFLAGYNFTKPDTN